MDRFSLNSPAELSRSYAMASSRNRDEDGYPDAAEEKQPEKCVFCDRIGGVPFLMIGDELHCSRCFEDFSAEEFRQYLIDSGIPRIQVQVVNGGADRAGKAA